MISRYLKLAAGALEHVSEELLRRKGLKGNSNSNKRKTEVVWSMTY